MEDADWRPSAFLGAVVYGMQQDVLYARSRRVA